MPTDNEPAVKCAYASLFQVYLSTVIFNTVRIDSSLDASRIPASSCNSNVPLPDPRDRPLKHQMEITAVLPSWEIACVHLTASCSRQDNFTRPGVKPAGPIPSWNCAVPANLASPRPSVSSLRKMLCPDMADPCYRPISRTRVEGVRERLEKSYSVMVLRVM